MAKPLWIGVILIAIHFIAEAHGFIWDFWPQIDDVKLDLFWSSSFKMKLSLHWWLKDLGDDAFMIVVFYLMARIAYQYSIKLYFICLIYMLYHIADALCFMYNYKQDRAVYWALFYSSALAVLILIWPNEKIKMHSVQ